MPINQLYCDYSYLVHIVFFLKITLNSSFRFYFLIYSCFELWVEIVLYQSEIKHNDWQQEPNDILTLIIARWYIAPSPRKNYRKYKKTYLLHTTHVCTFSCSNTSIYSELWASIQRPHTDNSNWIDFNLKYQKNQLQGIINIWVSFAKMKCQCDTP